MTKKIRAKNVEIGTRFDTDAGPSPVVRIEHSDPYNPTSAMFHIDVPNRGVLRVGAYSPGMLVSVVI